MDVIRWNYRCHIIYVSGFQAFKLYADHLEKLSAALREIGRALREKVAIGLDPTKIFLAKSPSIASQRVVKFSAHDPRAPSFAAGLKRQSPATIIRLTSMPPQEMTPLHKHQGATDINSLNVRIFKDALVEHLSNLRSYKKHVEMRCIFGLFVFQSYSWVPNDALDQPAVPFVRNLKNQRTKGALHSM